MSDSRTILITGCTRGLGRALAERWASEGHTIVGCGRSEDALGELRTSLGEPHRFDSVDVADEAAVGAWARSVLDTHGAPDLLFNNAAVIAQRAPLWEVPAEEISTLLDINVKGVISVIRHFVPAMIERGSGVVLNLSSGWGQISAPEVGPYCASKFAIEGLTGSLASELARELPRGLAAIPLSPGIIHTEMLDTAMGDTADQYWGTDEWVEIAAPFILGLGPEQNGQSVRVPERHEVES